MSEYSALLNEHQKRNDQLASDLQDLEEKLTTADADLVAQHAQREALTAKLEANKNALEVPYFRSRGLPTDTDILKAEKVRFKEALDAGEPPAVASATPQKRESSRPATSIQQDTIRVVSKRTPVPTTPVSREVSAASSTTPRSLATANRNSSILSEEYSVIVYDSDRKSWYAISCDCGVNATKKIQPKGKFFIKGLFGLRTHIRTHLGKEETRHSVIDAWICWEDVSEEDVQRIRRGEQPRMKIKKVSAQDVAKKAKQAAAAVASEVVAKTPQALPPSHHPQVTPVATLLSSQAFDANPYQTTEGARDTMSPRAAKRTAANQGREYGQSMRKKLKIVTEMEGLHVMDDEDSDDVPLSRPRKRSVGTKH